MKNFLNKLKRDYLDCTNNNKIFLVFLLCFFVCGIVIAIICHFRFRDFLTLNNLTDKLLLNYIKKSSSLFSYFILKFFNLILISLILILICFNKYLSYLTCILMLYLGYCLTFNFCLIILLFGVFGFIYGLILLVIFGLIYSFILFSICLFCRNIHFCHNTSYFKELKNLLPIFLTCLIIIFILLILEIILMPMLSNTFIIVLWIKNN